MNVVFQCEHCGASLKVRKAAAARDILCPKCGRKTAAPVNRQADEDSNGKPGESAGKISAAGPEGSGGPAGASVEDGAAAETRNGAGDGLALKSAVERAEKAEKEIRELRARDSEAEPFRARIAELESSLAEARQTGTAARQSLERDMEKADKTEARLRGDFEMRNKERADRHREEIAALRKEIAALRSAPSSTGSVTPPPVRAAEATTAPPENPRKGLATGPEDEVDPDSLIEPLFRHRFGPRLRNALLIHAAVILVTSVGFIHGCMRGGEDMAEASETVEAGQEQDSSPTPPDLDVPGEEQEGAVEGVPPASNGEGEAEPRAPTELEQRLEALPEAGEEPAPSAVEFDL